MEEVTGTIGTYVSLYGIRIIGAIVIFFVGKWLVRLVTKIVKRLMQNANLEETLVTFLGNLMYALLLTVVVLAAISQLGINTTSFIAILGAAGLAVGLALQGSLANFGAGVLLIIFQPFKAGDFVDAGGQWVLLRRLIFLPQNSKPLTTGRLSYRTQIS